MQTMDLGSSSRLGYGLSTLKTLLARRAAVHNLLSTSVRSFPYCSTYSMTEEVRGYGTGGQSFLDGLSFGAYSTQSLSSERRVLPLCLGAKPPVKATESNEDKFFFNTWMQGASRLTGGESPSKIGTL